MSANFYTSVDRWGNHILLRGFFNNKKISKRVVYEPILYVNSPHPTDFKTLDGKYVEEISFETMREATNFAKKYEDVKGFDVHGNQNYVVQFISECFPGVIEFDPTIINTTTIDIEVGSDKGFPYPDRAEYPVTAITVKNNIDNTFYTFGTGDWYRQDSTLDSKLKIKYTKCKDEVDLLNRFIVHWCRHMPDVITGWNNRIFDIPYIVNRIIKIIDQDTAQLLSPWKSVQERWIKISGKEIQTYTIAGIQQLDYLDLFKKFGYTYGIQENYKLDTVAFSVLGERKMDYSEYGDLNTLYKRNYQKYIDYNIKDVDIVDRFEDKMGLIKLAMTICYKAKANLAEAFGTVGVWDALIYNELKQRGIVVPALKNQKKDRQIEGAYVKIPQIGAHRWIAGWDYASLYPHVMMQYNLSPETITGQYIPGVNVEALLAKTPFEIPENRCMTALGYLFDTTKKGIIPQIIQALFNERVIARSEMNKLEKQRERKEGDLVELEKRIVTLDNKQQAIKILMNSLYGAMSNEFFRYFDMRIAESITTTGQLTNKWTELIVNKYLNSLADNDHEEEDFVVAMDTDSIYMRLDKFVPSDHDDPIGLIDALCKNEIAPLINQGCEDLRLYMGCTEQKMSMKRETIASKGIWTGKKHYILNILDKEGVRYAEPKIKMVGIEAVKSSTPQKVREMIKKGLIVVLNETEEAARDYIAQCREAFYNLAPEDVAFPRGVNNLDFYRNKQTIYDKGCPIHVRASLLYNYFLKERGISQKYEEVFNTDKIKYVYLKLPNRVRENVIAFKTVLPVEFGLNDSIDYDLQFEKAFLEPMKAFLSVINWQAVKIHTLEDLFE